MNKKLYSFLGIAAVIAGGLTSCSEEQTLAVGEGTLHVAANVNSNIVAVSRAENEAELAATTKIWIYSSEGVVRKYNSISEVPAGGVKLISGDYTVKAWAGTLSYASFTDRWFEGEETVTVPANGSISCTVECKIANVVVSVKYPDNVDELISDYSLTVSHKGGELTFDGKDESKGYYMMPEGETSLDYVMTFTNEGEQKTVRGTIANVEQAHEYILNVIANPSGGNDSEGAAWLTIEVDDTMIDVSETIAITPPPTIMGYGFDLSAPIAGEAGTIGRHSVYVCSASSLKSVVLRGLVNCGSITEVDFIRATETILQQLASSGIHAETEVVDGGVLMKIVFDAEYLNGLPNSDNPYVYAFEAVDDNGKSSTANMTLRISQAPVVAAPVTDSDVTYTKVSLTGTVAQDGVESVGFQYAPSGSEAWTYVAGSTTRAALAKGQAFYATVSGLEIGQTYDYRAVSGTPSNPTEFTGEILKFSTKGDMPQIVNNSFEQWSEFSDGAVMPMPSGSDNGWDSGNHGSKTMGVQLTNSSTDMKHSGAYSAKLRSQFVGVGTLGKFAAGNLFYGKYLETAGTDGVIGFGRQFAFPQSEIRPVAMRVWINYRPAAAVNKKGAGSHVPQGTLDVGHIFVGLFDAPDTGDSDSNYNGNYGYVVRTKNQSRLFDVNDPRIVAYGEKILDGDYGPDGQLQELVIPLDYRAGKGQPTYICVVFTASKFGDYFEGGEGSTMYVDDVELIYAPY